MSVGFGIIGSGKMGAAYAEALENDTQDTRFVGIAVGSRASRLAARYGVEHVPSFEAMLERPEVDAVVLATPHSAHLPEALAAAKAGKHILVEKPMALDTAECRQMIEACRAGDVLLTVGQVTRRAEAHRTARRMIDNGEIGDVRMIQIWRGGAGLPYREGSWSLDPAEGGPFLDWGSHSCDIMRWYAGAEPVLAFGQYANYDHAAEVQPSAMAQFTFANGVMAHVWMTYELPHASLGAWARYVVIGSKAILDIGTYGQVKRSREDGGWDVVYQSPDFVNADAGWIVKADDGSGYPTRTRYAREAFARQVQDLTDAIRQGRQPEVTGTDGLNAVKMVEAVAQSAKTGEAVAIAP